MTPERTANFETEIETLRSLLQIPGLAVGIAERGELVWSKGFGYSDVEAAAPVTETTPFRIASVTKTFTATLAMQFVEEGALDLDEPISNYGVSVGDPDVTVRHLLSHTSQGQPGSAFQYDGDLYAKVTTILEQAGGARYADLLEDGIFSPAGMTSTGPSLPGQATKSYGALWARLATPYRWDVNDGIDRGTYPEHFSGAAGLISTIEDLARYDAALDSGVLVDPASRDTMFAPSVAPDGTVLPYGLGWFTQEFQDNELVWHFGGTDIRNPQGRHGWESISALLLKVPDRGLTLIALANVDTVNRMYRLVEGDILRQALAVEFYGRFVADGVPVVDWTDDSDTLGAQLRSVTDPRARQVLERELAAYQLTYQGLDDADGAARLGSVLRSEFGWPPLVPVAPHASTTMRTWSWVMFWVLVGWAWLVVVSMVDVTCRLRRDGAGWAARVMWPAAALMLGPVGAIAHRMAGRMDPLRVALAASAVAVLAPLAATAGVVAWVGELDLRPVVFGFVLGLLLVRAPLRAGSIRRYLPAVGKSVPWELMTTLSVFAGILLAMVPLSDAYVAAFGLQPEPGSPAFWGICVAAGLAGLITTYPVQIWLTRRGRVAVPRLRFDDPVRVRVAEALALTTGSLGLLATGLFVIGAF